ncbi:hypothetical protein VTP01DRAFT_10181 [Rhizomucor pusillus]|uniref:uncharacterized protein n=1 Tax=Rhizomucor pusillus TaxID=4840 RepID=UPI0037445223
MHEVFFLERPGLKLLLRAFPCLVVVSMPECPLLNQDIRDLIAEGRQDDETLLIRLNQATRIRAIKAARDVVEAEVEAGAEAEALSPGLVNTESGDKHSTPTVTVAGRKRPLPQDVAEIVEAKKGQLANDVSTQNENLATISTKKHANHRSARMQTPLRMLQKRELPRMRLRQIRKHPHSHH